MSILIQYNDGEVGTFSCESNKTLLTAGKYCDGNIIISSNALPTVAEVTPYMATESGSFNNMSIAGFSANPSTETDYNIVIRNASLDYEYKFLMPDSAVEVDPKSVSAYGSVGVNVKTPSIQPKHYLTMMPLYVRSGANEYIITSCIGSYIYRIVSNPSSSERNKTGATGLYWYGLCMKRYFA